MIIDLEDALEVSIDGHELRGQARVSRDSDAVLPRHGHHGVAVVVEDGLKHDCLCGAFYLP